MDYRDSNDRERLRGPTFCPPELLTLEATSHDECDVSVDLMEPSYVIQVSPEHVHVEDLIGKGAFASVYTASVDEDDEEWCGAMCQRARASSHSFDSTIPDSFCTSTSSRFDVESMDEDRRYAVKRLNDRALQTPESTRVATKDILNEATILSFLPPHPNIITLYAISSRFWDDPTAGFLVLDRLSETLHDRLSRWRSAKTESPSLFESFLATKKKLQEEQKQMGRIADIGLPIAQALEYLHTNNICYLDLKPQNVGFDRNGHVRLFDFGFSYSFSSDKDRYTKGFTGTIRYMAPEIMRGDPYSTPADVYSFAVLLWEICTLQRPYARTLTSTLYKGQSP